MTDFAQQFAALATEVAGIDATAAGRLEAELRRRHGGQQVRIAERPPITLAAVDDGLRARKPVAVIATELGVHRATLYRLLKRRPAKSQAKD